jgi:hypothetical protein
VLSPQPAGVGECGPHSLRRRGMPMPPYPYPYALRIWLNHAVRVCAHVHGRVAKLGMRVPMAQPWVRRGITRYLA